MALQDELDRARRRASLRNHLAHLLSGFPAEEARQVLLDLLVALGLDEAPGARSQDDDSFAWVMGNVNNTNLHPGVVHHHLTPSQDQNDESDDGETVIVPHGGRADTVLGILERTGGGVHLETIARNVYGGTEAEARKKASSMLSLLKSQNKATKGNDGLWYPARTTR